MQIPKYREISRELSIANYRELADMVIGTAHSTLNLLLMQNLHNLVKPSMSIIVKSPTLKEN